MRLLVQIAKRRGVGQQPVETKDTLVTNGL